MGVRVQGTETNKEWSNGTAVGKMRLESQHLNREKDQYGEGMDRQRGQTDITHIHTDERNNANHDTAFGQSVGSGVIYIVFLKMRQFSSHTQRNAVKTVH